MHTVVMLVDARTPTTMPWRYLYVYELKEEQQLKQKNGKTRGLRKENDPTRSKQSNSQRNVSYESKTTAERFNTNWSRISQESGAH